MTVKIWLRAETKPREKRSALTPGSARELLAAGYEVFIERSLQSAIPAQAFEDVGCAMVTPGSWPQAPDDAIILGLKELPDDGTALTHRHIYFAHAYKYQRGWQETLRRFDRGGGQLMDIEFLLDENILGLDKYLPSLKIHKIGDSGYPPKSSKDESILDFAQENNLIIITCDRRFVKQIKRRKMECIYPRIDPQILADQILEWVEER